MSALVVDTSSWVSYFAGRGSPLINTALAEGRVYLPVVVAAELLSGRLPPRGRRDLERMLDALPLAPNDRQHWFRTGALRAALAAKALSVSTPDAHVAQAALDLGAELLTEDKVFARIATHAALKLA